ncbi:MAG: hypothetical protein ACRC5M_00325 [Anaeroplasmataceae bacterium]
MKKEQKSRFNSILKIKIFLLFLISIILQIIALIIFSSDKELFKKIVPHFFITSTSFLGLSFILFVIYRIKLFIEKEKKENIDS